MELGHCGIEIDQGKLIMENLINLLKHMGFNPFI
jgi:hypothetical protein